MTEAPLTRKFLAAVQAQLPNAVIFKINDRTTAGIPDAVISHDFCTVWLEFKKHPNKLTPLQKLNIDRINKGGRAMVITFHDQFVRVDDQSLLGRAFDASFDRAVAYVVGRL